MTTNTYPTETEVWNNVAEYCAKAKGAYWDGCHKIYLAMDNGEKAWFDEHEYPFSDLNPKVETIKDWFFRSCMLRFVQAVSTASTDPNDGFEDLISQFEYLTDEEVDKIEYMITKKNEG